MRYLEQYLKRDLEKKMVFISGPRQSGKTTLVKDLLPKGESLYLNWDDIDDRKKILKRLWPDEDRIIALDEIHKYSKWKNFLKGTYDTQKEIHNFIITGSAKLDIYKKGQDSMLGRFFSWRLHPLCLAELYHNFSIKDDKAIERLLELGGFPEAYFAEDTHFAKRWRKEKMNLIFRQDIRDLEKVRDISLLEILYLNLTERVGSEISYANLARDLELAAKTVKIWIEILEKTYTLFVIKSYSKQLSKAIVKAPKVYFYDNGEVDGTPGARFENLVANHLLKKIHFLEDSTGERYELNYVRDRNGHEVDFLIVKNRKPFLLIEVKLSDEGISRHLIYFKEKLRLEQALQLVLAPVKKRTMGGITVMSARHWLSQKLESDFVL